MMFDSLLNFFTKSVLTDLLDKLGDADYKSSWSKGKLVSQLKTHGAESVLKKLTVSQLNDLLDEHSLVKSGTKADKVSRLVDFCDGNGAESRSRPFENDFSIDELSKEQLLEFGVVLYHFHYYDEDVDFVIEEYELNNMQKIGVDVVQSVVTQWKFVGREYFEIDVNNHSCYALYNCYFVNGSKGVEVSLSQQPCEGAEVDDVNLVNVSKRNVPVYCFNNKASSLGVNGPLTAH